MKNLALSLQKTDFVIANYKTKIELLKLRNINPWLNFKILTPQEVISLFLGSPSEATLNYIIEELGVPYYYAKLINENIIFPNLSAISHKSKELSTIREKLLRNGFFDEIRLAKVTFFQKRVLLSPELAVNKLLLSLLASAQCKLNYFPELTTYNHMIVKYDNGIVECYALLNKIAALLDAGVTAKAITIVTKNNNFQTLIRAFAPSFNLKIEKENLSLLTYPAVMSVVEKIKDNETSFHQILDELEVSGSKALLALKNLYRGIELSAFPKNAPVQFFIEKVKATKLNEDEGECISFSNELPLFSTNDEHFFVPNFAEGSFSLTSSSLYLNNNERIALGLNGAEENGAKTELLLSHSLKNLKNVHLSFSPLLENEEFTLFSLSEKLGFIVDDFTKDYTYYSQAYLNYLTGNDLDTRFLFNKINKTLSYYFYNNPDVTSYNIFNHEFKGINYRPESVRLSYSRINIYQRSPFDYFAQYVLGFTDAFNTPKVNFGSFVHKILENSQSEATFKFNFYRLLDDESISAKERFFILNRQEFIFKVFQNYLSYIDYAKPSEIITEEPIKVKIKDDCTLEGRIDNLFIFERNDQKHLLVVDYKTGTINNNESLYEKGLHLQLPLYGLLLKLSPKFHDATISGLVYSSLKLPPYTLGDETILNEVAWKKGRFTGNILEGDALSIIDPQLEDKSEFFMGIRQSKGSISGTINQERLAEHINIAEEKVFETYQGIKNSDFKVRVFMENRRKVSDYGAYRNISYLPLHELGEDEGEDVEDE